jgi:hypothetical protein
MKSGDRLETADGPAMAVWARAGYIMAVLTSPTRSGFPAVRYYNMTVNEFTHPKYWNTEVELRAFRDRNDPYYRNRALVAENISLPFWHE